MCPCLGGAKASITGVAALYGRKGSASVMNCAFHRIRHAVTIMFPDTGAAVLTPSPLETMEPPVITRRRRPFLAPVWLILLAGLVVLGLALALWKSATNTVVVIVPSAEGALGSIDNPPLSAVGGQQAQQLAQRFAGASGPDGLDAIFVSRTRRAEQTASPLAQLLDLKPIALASRDGDAMASEIMNRHGGDAVLVVCNRADIAALVQALSGLVIAAPTPRDLYVITVPRYGPAKVLRMTD